MYQPEEGVAINMDEMNQSNVNNMIPRKFRYRMWGKHRRQVKVKTLPNMIILICRGSLIRRTDNRFRHTGNRFIVRTIGFAIRAA